MLCSILTVADPGFSVQEDVNLMGGTDCQGGYVLKILYVKTKESGLLEGAHQQRPLDPPMLKIKLRKPLTKSYECF